MIPTDLRWFKPTWRTTWRDTVFFLVNVDFRPQLFSPNIWGKQRSPKMFESQFFERSFCHGFGKMMLSRKSCQTYIHYISWFLWTFYWWNWTMVRVIIWHQAKQCTNCLGNPSKLMLNSTKLGIRTKRITETKTKKNIFAHSSSQLQSLFFFRKFSLRNGWFFPHVNSRQHLTRKQKHPLIFGGVNRYIIFL